MAFKLFLSKGFLNTTHRSLIFLILFMICGTMYAFARSFRFSIASKTKISFSLTLPIFKPFENTRSISLQPFRYRKASLCRFSSVHVIPPSTPSSGLENLLNSNTRNISSEIENSVDFRKFLTFLSEFDSKHDPSLEVVERYYREYGHLSFPELMQRRFFHYCRQSHHINLALEIIKTQSLLGQLEPEIAYHSLIRCYCDAKDVQAAYLSFRRLNETTGMPMRSICTPIISCLALYDQNRIDESVTSILLDVATTYINIGNVSTKNAQLIIDAFRNCRLIDDRLPQGEPISKVGANITAEQQPLWAQVVRIIAEYRSKIDTNDAVNLIYAQQPKKKQLKASEIREMKTWNQSSEQLINMYRTTRMESKSTGSLKNAQNMLAKLLNFCQKAEDTQLALEIFNDMVLMGAVPAEASFLALIRCYSAGNETEKALAVIKEMEFFGIDVKLRSYLPLIDAFVRLKDFKMLLFVIRQYYEKSNQTTSPQFRVLLEQFLFTPELEKDEALVNEMNIFFRKAIFNSILGLSSDDISSVIKVANRLSDDEINRLGTVVSSDELKVDASIVHETKKSDAENATTSTDFEIINATTDSFSTITESLDDVAKSYNSRELFVEVVPGQPLMRARRMKLPSIKNSDRSNVKDRTCPHCLDNLKQLPLTEDERLRIRVALVKIAGSISLYQWRHLQSFDEWLKGRPPFTYIVDGANIAYHRQNFPGGKFSFRQIEIVVNELKKRGERILVLLPDCYVNNKLVPNSITMVNSSRAVPRSKEDEEIVERFRSEDSLFLVPSGGNDDWYWMYSTIIEGRSQLSYVVTNDMMRDHKLAFMEPRPFLRWQMTQVINFDLSKAIESHVHDVDVILNDPLPFSREIQETGSGRLHIPSLDDDTWLCLKLRGE